MPAPAGRFLHIFHNLRLQPEEYRALGRKKARLSVSSKALGQAAVPADGITVRKPFPNKSYLVGGSKESWRGWVIPLPEGMQSCDLTADWEVPLDGQFYKVRHAVELRFAPALEGRGTVYSMHPVYWGGERGPKSALGELPPMSLLPYVTLTADDLQAARKVWRDDEGDLVTLREVIQMPAVPLGRFRILRKAEGEEDTL